jgi:hypothetical protein
MGEKYIEITIRLIFSLLFQAERDGKGIWEKGRRR